MNLLKFAEQSEGALTEARKRALLESLKADLADSCTVENAIVASMANYEADEYSGYRKLDLLKFYNTVLFLCKEGVVKTKLNKLLFYADFKNFKTPLRSPARDMPIYLSVPPPTCLYYATMRSLRMIDFIEAVSNSLANSSKRAGNRSECIRHAGASNLLSVKADFEAYCYQDNKYPMRKEGTRRPKPEN